MKSRRGQATTEVVLLFPIFMFFLFAFVKIYALLILVQKMEIASYYGARRWQLESHRNVDHEGHDQSVLRDDIERRISQYLGFGGGADNYGQTTEGFLDLVRITGHGARFRCEPTQVWNICTLEVQTRAFDVPGIRMFYKYEQPVPFKVTKYVPNRDRPIQFILPGLRE
ncbi:MAG: pilus assembly protein [Elusimicrobia bacterium]|nr:pilus assembly protein [Elusimicrobiota bacterium]